jgi:hypothetical protein
VPEASEELEVAVRGIGRSAMPRAVVSRSGGDSRSPGYEVTTVPELLLLDQAMLAYFHTVRLSNQIADMLSIAETDLQYPEALHVKIKERDGSSELDGFMAEDAIKQLQERLMPLVERFSQMFLRNLRALRELKTNPININIGQAGQVSVGQQQVNVSDGSGRT